MGNRSEKVGERDYFFTDSRRIVGLCNENLGKMDRSHTFAVDSAIIRRPPRVAIPPLPRLVSAPKFGLSQDIFISEALTRRQNPLREVP